MVMSVATKPTKSVQTYQTPPELFDALWNAFNVEIAWDLAANEKNSAASHSYYGPGSKHGEDSLKEPWQNGVSCVDGSEWMWLNPPYKNVSPWMKKCRDESRLGARIVTLTLACPGTKWYQKFVRGNALALTLTNRVTFVGESAPYPRELMICLWCNGLSGEGYWDWKKSLMQ
jgi:hypothetical protein